MDPKEILPVVGPDGMVEENPVIKAAEKVIHEKEAMLRKYIDDNYSKIRSVEKELAGLAFEMKMTSGPKKAALEHLRKKIEQSAEKIKLAKVKEEAAKKAWEAAAKIVADEEAAKQKLCNDLNSLVQESAAAQFSKLEELTRKLDALNPAHQATLEAVAVLGGPVVLPRPSGPRPDQPATTTSQPQADAEQDGITAQEAPSTAQAAPSANGATAPSEEKRPSNGGEETSAKGSTPSKKAGESGAGGRGGKSRGGRGRGRLIMGGRSKSETDTWTGAGFDVTE